MDYNEEYISNPRHVFKEEKKPKKKFERLKMGTQSGGIIFDVTRDGIEVNGYYQGFSNDTAYSCMREPVKISWEDLEKARRSVAKRKKKSVQRIEREIDEEYLKKLPIVHLNGVPYYIDAERKERRPVKNPHVINKF